MPIEHRNPTLIEKKEDGGGLLFRLFDTLCQVGSGYIWFWVAPHDVGKNIPSPSFQSFQKIFDRGGGCHCLIGTERESTI